MVNQPALTLCIVGKGNITATIIWFAITTGATAELSYNKEEEESLLS